MSVPHRLTSCNPDDALGGPQSPLGVGGEHILEAADRPPGAPFHHGFNDRGDAGKVQSPLEEGL